MELCIIAVGQRMPHWVDTAFDDYAKRMPSEYRLLLKEVKAEARTTGKTVPALMAAEAERLQQALPKQAYVIALDERGKDLTTVQIAQHLQQWQHDTPSVAFLIGGADGLAPELKTQARAQWRLSSLTLPHGLVRVMLAEQLYRAWSLLQGHPYHRA
jgi:23S rRNA (pseudouridine1915-N3)-methyltransferase